MGANGVRKLLDADTRDDFVVACDLQEFLVENVVFIGIHKGRNIADHCKHIKLISFDSVIRQEDVMQLEIEEMVAQTAHHFVCLHVVHVENIQVVETIIE